MTRISHIALVVTFTTGWAALSLAQTPPANPPALRLGLGDYMTAFVQPRHLKLGISGQKGNWDNAAYAHHELEESFERIERQVPVYRNMAMADLLKMVEGPMKAVDEAIKARDGARFDAAFTQLTDACNACHVTTERKMIVIQVPKVSPFANQKLDP
jgi:hypothetical protein